MALMALSLLLLAAAADAHGALWDVLGGLATEAQALGAFNETYGAFMDKQSMDLWLTAYGMPTDGADDLHSTYAQADGDADGVVSFAELLKEMQGREAGGATPAGFTKVKLRARKGDQLLLDFDGQGIVTQVIQRQTKVTGAMATERIMWHAQCNAGTLHKKWLKHAQEEDGSKTANQKKLTMDGPVNITLFYKTNGDEGSFPPGQDADIRTDISTIDYNKPGTDKMFGKSRYQANRFDAARPYDATKDEKWKAKATTPIHIDGSATPTDLPTWVMVKRLPSGKWYKKLAYGYLKDDKSNKGELLRDNGKGKSPTKYSMDEAQTKLIKTKASIEVAVGSPKYKAKEGDAAETPQADRTWEVFRKKGKFKILKYCGESDVELPLDGEPLVKGDYLSYELYSKAFHRMDAKTFKTYAKILNDRF